MKRVIVIGCPGSGKSTFAKVLHRKTGLPLVHLDNLFWNADKTTVDRAVFRERLSRVLAQEEWIVDGNYSSTMEWRLQACDTVIFLDYPTELCLQGARERRGKARSDIPWTETEEDPEFMEFIKSYAEKERPKVIALLEQYTEKAVFTFKSRAEADAFLA